MGRVNQLLDDGAVIEAMRRWGGGFVKALAEAATIADSDNLRRIKSAWPEYWQRYSDMANDESELTRSRNKTMETQENIAGSALAPLTGSDTVVGLTEEKELCYQHAMRGLQDSLDKARAALDALALALTEHHHQWTPEERALYEAASPGDGGRYPNKDSATDSP